MRWANLLVLLKETCFSINVFHSIKTLSAKILNYGVTKADAEKNNKSGSVVFYFSSSVQIFASKNDSSFVQGQRADLIQRTNEAGFQQTINCPVSFFLVMVADLIKATPTKVSPLLPIWTKL